MEGGNNSFTKWMGWEKVEEKSPSDFARNKSPLALSGLPPFTREFFPFLLSLTLQSPLAPSEP